MYQVTLATGAVKVIYTGPLLRAPSDIAVSADNSVLLVADEITGLFRIELNNLNLASPVSILSDNTEGACLLYTLPVLL